MWAARSKQPGKSAARASWPSMDINVATAMVLSSSCPDDDDAVNSFAKSSKLKQVRSADDEVKKRPRGPEVDLEELESKDWSSAEKADGLSWWQDS